VEVSEERVLLCKSKSIKLIGTGKYERKLLIKVREVVYEKCRKERVSVYEYLGKCENKQYSLSVLS